MSLLFIFMVLYAIFVVISVISLVIPVISVISVNRHTALNRARLHYDDYGAHEKNETVITHKFNN